MKLLMLKNQTVPSDLYHTVFTSYGHTPQFLPLLDHGPTDVEATTAYLCSDFARFSAFIITSQRAVEVFRTCLQRIEAKDAEKAREIRRKVGYTVGPATAHILKEIGFADVRGSDAGNGSLLADLILQEQPESLVFFTGVIRKDIIPVKLRKHGVALDEVVIYKTEPKRDIIERFRQCSGYDWVVFFSPQGTEEIVNHIVSSGLAVKTASIGPTTEEYLLEKGIKADVVAQKPTAESLYHSIMVVVDGGDSINR